MLASTILATLLAAPALVLGAPTYITDPGSSGLLIKPSSASSPTVSRALDLLTPAFSSKR
jgi:hypothetical protein